MVLLIAAACAPEPTAPAKTSLAGVWTANAHLYTLSDIRLDLVQEPGGIVSGTWSAKGDGGRGGCLDNIPCDASGDLIGTNTVSQVELAMIGAGKFEGTLVEPTRMRGIFLVGESFDTITFVRGVLTFASRGVESR